MLVDCPAGASRAAADPLRHADAVLLVTTADPQTVEDALKTVAMARTLGTRVLGVVCNQVDAVSPSLATAFDAPCLVSLPRVRSAPIDACRGSFNRLAAVVGPNP